MKSLNAYLAGLDNELNTFNPSEWDEILSEIEAHIADGLEDAQMGDSKEERAAKLLAELGEPAEMAAGSPSSAQSLARDSVGCRPSADGSHRVGHYDDGFQ